MILMDSLNIFLAPLGALILVTADYARHHTADPFPRRIMSAITGAAVLAIGSEIIFDAAQARPGDGHRLILQVSCFFFFIFQLFSFSAIPLFLDYHLNRDLGRLKKLTVIVAAISAANLVSLVVNIQTGFYFEITPANTYVRGSGHWVRVLLDFSLLAIIIPDIWLSRKNLQRQQLFLFSLLVIPAALCGALDLIIPGSRLLWPSFGLGVLFAYLFIIKADFSLDSLTGVHNRRQSDEFLAELGRTPRRRPYLFIMIDLDHFKEINDRFGHPEGDRALRDVAVLLKSALRHRDFIARYGGDEFLLILEDQEHPEAIIARLHQHLDEFNTAARRPYLLAMSAGAAIYGPADPESPQEFLKRVDKLMYQQKYERRRSA